VATRKTDGQHTVDRCLGTEAQTLEIEALLVCWKIYLISDMSDIACSETEWQMYCYAHICGQFFMHCYSQFSLRKKWETFTCLTFTPVLEFTLSVRDWQT
jgi:hypothetical protein